MAKVTLHVTKQGKEFVVAIGERELETAEVQTTKTGWVLDINDIEIWDPYYLSVPKEFERLHKDLMSLIKDVAALNRLYTYMLTSDMIRKKHFSDHSIVPYYIIPSMTVALLENNACIMQNGVLKKKERFTRYLILRDEMIADMTGGELHTDSVKDVERIKSEEERAERRYRLPPINELKDMNYEMLTLEMAKAEEMMAKPKVIKVLKDLRLAKAPTKSRKTEMEKMKEIIQEEHDEHEPETRLAKHQRRKSEKAIQEKVRFERPKSTTGKVKISQVEGAEYVE